MTDRHRLHFTGRNILAAPALVLSAITAHGLHFLDGTELCKNTDPEIFHPSGKGASSRPAKLICAACPLQEACLQAALDREEPFGIWGGLTAYERNRLHRTAPTPIGSARSRKPRQVPDGCGTNTGYYRHREALEDACSACKAAHAAVERKRAARVENRKPGVCRAAGPRHDSEAAATAALAGQPATARVFRCGGCRGWHITTRPLREAKAVEQVAA